MFKKATGNKLEIFTWSHPKPLAGLVYTFGLSANPELVVEVD